MSDVVAELQGQIDEKQRELKEVTNELNLAIDNLDATNELLHQARTKLDELNKKYADRLIQVNNSISDALRRQELLEGQIKETEQYVSDERAKIKREWRTLQAERNKLSRTGNSSAFPDLS